jgi:hypothetical protein
MHLQNYLRAAVLPTPPASCDYSAAGAPALQNIYLNDQYGDCVIAGGYHVVGLETGNANGGHPFVATTQQIVADYSAIGGFDPNNPQATDNGCDEQTALNYWTQHGFADGTKLIGWLAVDATNMQQVMTAMFLFENLFFGIELPDAWINPMPSASGFVWDVGTPDPDNGHCVMGVGYTPQGVKIDTWGMFGTLTWAAIAALCTQSGGGELYVMLTPDQLAKGQAKAPNGINWTSLLTDFNTMGGNVPVPAPAPAPPAPAPTPPHPAPPAPTGAPTLVQAIAWATQGLQKNWPAGH